MKKFLVVTLFFISFFQANSQYIEYGAGLGLSAYWGDLNAADFGTNLGNGGLAFQGSLRMVLDKSLSVRGNLLYGKLSGDDARSSREFQQLRNLSFESPLVELAVIGEYHFFGYNTWESESPFSPYISLGISGIYFDPSTTFEGQTVKLQPLGTEGQGMPGFADKYNKVSFAIPFGAGVKYKFNKRTNIYIDILARRTFTDYIDDVSGTYVAYEELVAGNGELAANLGNRMGEALMQDDPVSLPTGTKRGGENVTDYFLTAMVTFTFNLDTNLGLFNKGYRGKKLECPKF